MSAAIGGILSVALSLGFPLRRVTGRALPATLVSRSPDFPRRRLLSDAAARPPGGGLSSLSGVAIQEQLEQDRAHLAVDLAVDLLGPPAALERLDRLRPAVTS